MLDEDVAVLDFSQQRDLAADGWLQGRYYGEEGETVASALSFASVNEICPFEVGVDRRAEKRAYARRYARIVRLMELGELASRPFNTLSNGEMRRVLFARAVLKNPKRLILDDPMGGLDPRQRTRLKRIIGALAKDGIEIELRCRHDDERPGSASAAESEQGTWCAKGPKRRVAPGEPVIEIRGLDLAFGRRRLFEGFDWTVWRGERWILRGPNGSGKTTLMALVTGDSPLAYAHDVRVFGIPRKPGTELAAIRRRIAQVSPEMQTYLGKGPDELLDEALAAEPELLILDEPCLNLDAGESRRLLARVSSWLKARPGVTAIVIAHRRDHVPAGFDRELVLAP